TDTRSSREISFSFLPNTSTSPFTGVLSPTMERRSTDLPVPDPPMTPRTSPRSTSRSRSSCTVIEPNRLVRPRTPITTSSAAGACFLRVAGLWLTFRGSYVQEVVDHCEHRIDRDDKENGLDDRRSGAAAERDNVALNQETLAAADHGDDEGEHRRLHD